MGPDIVVAFGRGWRWPLRAEDTLEVWDGTELVTTLPAAVVYQVLGLLGALRTLEARIGTAWAAPQALPPDPPALEAPRLRGLGGRHLRYTQRSPRRNPMMKGVLIVVGLILMGCTAWVKPGASHDEAVVAYQECAAIVPQTTDFLPIPIGGLDLIYIPISRSDDAALRACMEGKGYRPQSEAGTAPMPPR